MTRGAEEGARSAAVRSREFIMRKNDKKKKRTRKIKKGGRRGERAEPRRSRLFKLRVSLKPRRRHRLANGVRNAKFIFRKIAGPGQRLNGDA